MRFLKTIVLFQDYRLLGLFPYKLVQSIFAAFCFFVHFKTVEKLMSGNTVTEYNTSGRSRLNKKIAVKWVISAFDLETCVSETFSSLPR